MKCVSQEFLSCKKLNVIPLTTVSLPQLRKQATYIVGSGKCEIPRSHYSS
ncbi:hypothetical protein CIPAW_09G183900 [Carya illinoinensis]|uniref:Uncharacterized protein n=1 Tax=Carya illinoinensis TaxID=32201 RepID=A0A8T1PRX0_CARIL|nr:hypothetical protein CIPAW_09G183900 [Carya illinoinensis]